MAGFADIEEVLDQATPVLMVAEEDAFATKGNVFCVMIPLITHDGQRFEDLPESFPNRGRVWWLVGRDGETARRPRHGEVISAALEEAPNYVESKPDKERYQVRLTGPLTGTRRWWQVIELPDAELKVADLVSDRGIAWSLGAPLGRVVVSTGDSVIGPFNTRYDSSSDRLILTPLSLGKPLVRIMDRSEFEKRVPIEAFDHTVYSAPYRDAPYRGDAIGLSLRLVHEKHFALIDKLGRGVDASSDVQLVKWALGQLGMTSAQQRLFKDALQNLPPLAAQHEAELGERHRRFKELCAWGDVVAGLGVEVAKDLAEVEPFRALVTSHVDAVARDRIEKVVATRKADVDAAIATLEKRRSALAGEYDDAKKQQEESLKRDHAAWVAQLDAREADLNRRDQALNQKETGIAARLERLIDRFGDASNRVADEVLAQLPILRRLGLGGGAQAGTGDHEVAPRAIVAPFVARPVPRENITETAFIDQLHAVVSARGLAFSSDDLVNFHIATKAGTWTVLAGPSGIGKSSLPRYYAEALGMKDEFKKVEVRPDWLDDRDVIGAFNPLAGRFEPATSGLVDQLIAAHEDLAKNRGGIYLICLDEMNLARVEHYFAQFLSIMEEPVGERVLRLFSRGLEKAGEPYARYRELPIGDNVRFVGTVNIDETTHFFSPKVLDRASVLTLDDIDHSRVVTPSRKARDLPVQPVHMDIYRGWVRDAGQAPPDVRDLVVKMDKALRVLGSGLGHRLLDRVLRHVASANDLLPRDRALDFALAQSVLPRIPTHHPQFGVAVDDLLALLPAGRYARTGKMLRAMKDAGGDHGFFQLL